MKKIDWYILKKLLVTFVFVLIMFEIIICVLDYTDKNDDFIKYKLSYSLIWKYYFSLIPYIASFLTPIFIFIATVFVTAKMASRTEIIAIMASGISFKRMLLPYFIGAVIIGSVNFYLNSYTIPNANKFRVEFELKYIKDVFYNTDRNFHIKIAERDSLNDYIYMNRYDVRSNVGFSVILETIYGTQLVEKLTARQIDWDTTGIWKLKNWQKREIKDMREIITSGEELDTILNLSPKDFGNKHRVWEAMTMDELNEHIELQKSRGADDVHIFQIEKYIRYMSPFTVLILMVIGVIVSSRKSRQGTGFQIALGFVIAFAFIITFVLTKAIAEAGTMNTILAIWMPNILFTGVALLLYKIMIK